MRLRLALLVMLAGACRGFFDPRGSCDPPGPGPTVVNSRQASSASSASIAPFEVGAGDLIVVAVVTDAVVRVQTIGDALGNVYQPVGPHPQTGDHQAGMWYVANAMPGTTGLDVTLDNPYHLSVWLLELSGMVEDVPLDTAATNTLPSGSDGVGASVTTTRPNELVFVAIGLDGNDAVTGLTPDTLFTALPISDGIGAAYLIAPSPGTYTATWISTNPNLVYPCSVGASFKSLP